VSLDINVIVLCITREHALSDSSPELPVLRPTIPGRYLNPEMLTDPTGRAVDTVAHEIAHFLLGHHENEKRTISARPGASAGAGATKGSRWSEERRAMGTCKYEACGTIAEVDDQGACPKCAEIAAKIRDRILQGLMTRYHREGASGRFAREAGRICAACDEEIRAESHWVSGERRFHEVCHEIWMKE
jgi:hypothetical protein